MLNADSSNQVNVLLSTYNGEAYLHEQLQSLYQQTYENIRIFVRDDGSSDSTYGILQQVASENRIFLQRPDANIGPAASFFSLLDISGDAGFYAFCDQDDIWNRDKLERAVLALGSLPEDIPAMYFSRLDYVDANNQFIKLSPQPEKIGFGNALVENIATGCTVVLNKSARDLIIKSLPDRCLMHDSWCYLVISCFGEVLFDDQSTMRYRQHSNNAIGAATSVWDSYIRRVKRFSLFKHGVFRFSDQAETFLERYSEVLSDEAKALLLEFLGAKKLFLGRFRLVFNRKIWRQSILDNLILKLLILMNRY
ncbi:MAG: glycosyltransferase family 2 protein [Methylotenera sp.]|uniref:glycosyltransferase family 2 protein n=1 Tax=Methylotenera sp. TaxID=2051956 RepID=UPI00248A2F5A|nr:glycosyltransferase family 2 protein [Methylotenera sp.]MDI1307811.1 glycosyltransferase family 2 protein [Methylotenera sp.]